jgi:hypothetical protein
MKLFLLAVTTAVTMAGCVVYARENHYEAPPPAQDVTVTYGWNHHRYVVWREYYDCSDDEVYYLENCGYDDDDILVCLYLARRARVPLRQVFYEYDRCGRSHYTLATSFGLPWDVWFSPEVPRGAYCPPVYARSYGHYWRGERYYYSNHEIHALIHLQVGMRYYGYSPATYFNEYDSCVRRGERAPFRAVVTRNHSYAGRGGRSWDDRRVVARDDRPWNYPNPQAWEQRRQAERELARARYTPQRERQEAERARRDADAHKNAHEEAKRQVEQARVRRQEADRKHDEVIRPNGPDRELPSRNERTPEKRDPPPPPPKGTERRDSAPPPPKGPDRESAPERRKPPPPPPRGPERRDPPPPPPKGPDRERAPERRNQPPPPPNGPERTDPPPPPKGPGRERAPERRDPPPPPPKAERRDPPPPKEREKGPPPKRDNGGPKKAPADDRRKR